jgi:hypothetical protein
VVEVLLAAAPAYRLHGAHPEVVAIGPDYVDGLAKAQLNLEPVAVELDDLQRLQGEVRGEQEDRAADGVVDEDETHDAASRSPEQVQTAVAQHHVLFPVDGAERGNEPCSVLGNLLDLNFRAVDPRPSLASVRRRHRRVVGDRVAANPAHQVVSTLDQGGDDGAAGVVGIGDQEELAVPDPGEREQQGHQFVEEGPMVTVREHQPLVDTRYQRHSGDLAGGTLDQEGDGLEGVAHDVFGLGIVARLLMEKLDAGHLFAFLGRLDAVREAHQPAPGQERSEQDEGEADPALGQDVQIQGLAVKQRKKPVIGGGTQIEDPDKAGDAREIRPAAHAHEGKDQPEKGPGSTTGRAKGAYGFIPGEPEVHALLHAIL